MPSLSPVTAVVELTDCFQTWLGCTVSAQMLTEVSDITERTQCWQVLFGGKFNERDWILQDNKVSFMKIIIRFF